MGCGLAYLVVIARVVMGCMLKNIRSQVVGALVPGEGSHVNIAMQEKRELATH